MTLRASTAEDGSARFRALVLTAALLSWGTAGVELGIGPLTATPAAREFAGELSLNDSRQTLFVGQWFAYFIASFLLGAAAGGWLFGHFADRFGRVRALGLAVVCFSLFTAANAWVRSPEQLAALRFLASLGIGGTWAAATPLLAEAWPKASRPMAAGLLGASANVGILVIALVSFRIHLDTQTWRTATLIGGLPVIVGVWILLVVPESPRWRRQRALPDAPPARPLAETLSPPILGRTIIGTLLGTVPLLGTWSASKWILPWAETTAHNQELVYAIWAGGAVVGSLAGGPIANLFGRRLTYFVICVATLAINLVIYRLLTPSQPAFLAMVGLLGVVATMFFGWLPLYLPELFPTRIRATGLGVAFNSGRILSAAGVLSGAALIDYFDGSYPRVGESLAWIYLVGMVAILFAPDSSRGDLED